MVRALLPADNMLAQGGLLVSEAAVQQVIAWVQQLQGDLSAANSTTTALSTFGSCNAANPFRSTIYLAKISTKLLLMSRVLVPVLGACLICALMALEWDTSRQGGHHDDDELHPGHSGPIPGADSQYTGGSRYNSQPKYVGP
jgi:hypothetical protein